MSEKRFSGDVVFSDREAKFYLINKGGSRKTCSLVRMRSKVRMSLAGQLVIRDAFDEHAMSVAKSIAPAMTSETPAEVPKDS